LQPLVERGCQLVYNAFAVAAEFGRWKLRGPSDVRGDVPIEEAWCQLAQAYKLLYYGYQAVSATVSSEASAERSFSWQRESSTNLWRISQLMSKGKLLVCMNDSFAEVH
jgi:hypothetical protein